MLFGSISGTTPGLWMMIFWMESPYQLVILVPTSGPLQQQTQKVGQVLTLSIRAPVVELTYQPTGWSLHLWKTITSVKQDWKTRGQQMVSCTWTTLSGMERTALRTAPAAVSTTLRGSVVTSAESLEMTLKFGCVGTRSEEMKTLVWRFLNSTYSNGAKDNYSILYTNGHFLQQVYIYTLIICDVCILYVYIYHTLRKFF